MPQRAAALRFSSMAEELGSQAAGLLIAEAWNANQAGRYQQALAAAARRPRPPGISMTRCCWSV